VPRYLDPPAEWAGSDPRAEPAATILAAGERAVAAAVRITRHLHQAIPDATVVTVRLEGPRGLRAVLTAEAVPLLSVIVDADLGRWEHRMSETEGPLLALRSAASVLAGLLPAAAADQVRQATAGTELTAVDDEQGPSCPRNCPWSRKPSPLTPPARQSDWPAASPSPQTKSSSRSQTP